MSSMPDASAEIIAFPRVVRTVELPDAGARPDQHGVEQQGPGVVVDHDGRSYAGAVLLGQLDQAVMDDIMASAPRSWQQAWDLVVRRFPRLAEAAVARCEPIR